MTIERNRTNRHRPPPYPRFAMPTIRAHLRPSLPMTGIAAGLVMLMALLFTSAVQAQQGVHAAGDAIVTGFSSVTPPKLDGQFLMDDGGGFVPVREQTCPSAYRWDGQQCVRGVTLLPVPGDGCRRGFWRTEGRCCPLGQAWNGERCGTPTDERPSCPPGVTGVYPDCVVVAMRRCPSGFSGRPPVCCPPSTRFANGRCVKRGEEEAGIQCGRGLYLSEGHCCARGTVWNGKRCLRNPGLQPSCPPGTTGAYPNCRTATGRTCPPGTTGRFPDCERQRSCPAGTTGAWPNCRAFQAERCPPGTRGAYPNCIATARNCPPGTYGVPPLCRSRAGRPCPSGTVGSGGRCVQLQPLRPVPVPRTPPRPQFRPTPSPRR